MTPKKTPEAPETPVQSDEVRQAILSKSTAGGDTAVGNARRAANDEENDVPQGEDRGSTIPIVGGNPQPDLIATEAIAPIGAQAQESAYSTNGSLPVNHVASSSGLVPVSAVATSPEQGAKLVADHLAAEEKHILRSGSDKLSRAKIESMSGAELRAVASARGYDLGDYAGARATRQRFIRAQQEDDDAADDTASTTEASTSEA